MKKSLIILLLFLLFLSILFSGCLDKKRKANNKPSVEIISPIKNSIILRTVKINGTASDIDNDITKVEIKFNEGSWIIVDGINNWSYNWNTYSFSNGDYDISVRAWDDIDYSDIEEISVFVENPKDVEQNTHKWAVFIAAANFPKENESKLGNGGLYLAENMSKYFIENLSYSTSNIAILFDDGWIRSNNGLGKPIQKLENYAYEYNVTYSAATKQNVIYNLDNVIEQSNKYDDSEVFIWIFNHGYGDYSKEMTGGKILENSIIFVWDNIIVDKELGNVLNPLRSDKACILVDACYSGGFADKTIFNIPSLLKSGIPKPGRVVITGESKFRLGYASPSYGPLFSLIWFDGLKTGNADGFRPGFLKTGRLPFLMFKDGKVSVEEAFYYARWVLKNERSLENYNKMEPQINDQYPNKGFLRSYGQLILG